MNILRLNEREKKADIQQEKLIKAWKKSIGPKPKPKRKKKARSLPIKQKRVNYYKYIKSQRWKAKRERALTHHGRYCRVCGTHQNLTVHHLTYKRLGHEKMEDLTVLCWEHHKEHHNEINSLSNG